MQKRTKFKFAAVCAMLAGSSASFGQDTIKIANIVELSGSGATSGTNHARTNPRGFGVFSARQRAHELNGLGAFGR